MLTSSWLKDNPDVSLPVRKLAESVVTTYELWKNADLMAQVEIALDAKTANGEFWLGLDNCRTVAMWLVRAYAQALPKELRQCYCDAGRAISNACTITAQTHCDHVAARVADLRKTKSASGYAVDAAVSYLECAVRAMNTRVDLGSVIKLYTLRLTCMTGDGASWLTRWRGDRIGSSIREDFAEDFCDRVNMPSTLR